MELQLESIRFAIPLNAQKRRSDFQKAYSKTLEPQTKQLGFKVWLGVSGLGFWGLGFKV